MPRGSGPGEPARSRPPGLLPGSLLCRIGTKPLGDEAATRHRFPEKEHVIGRILIALVAAVGLLPGQAAGLGGKPEPGADTRARTSLELITEAVERGELDPDTAVLYRVYAVTDDAKLPARYRGEAPIKDGTPVLRHARSRYDSLRPEIREALRPYLFPKEKR